MSCLEVLELKASKYPRFIYKDKSSHFQGKGGKGGDGDILKKAIACLEISLLANSFISHIKSQSKI